MIWTSATDEPADRPTFVLTGLMLRWADRSPAHVRQWPFAWADCGWEAAVELTRAGKRPLVVNTSLCLTPAVWRQWRLERRNPLQEAARQLHAVMQARGWSDDLGRIVLR